MAEERNILFSGRPFPEVVEPDRDWNVVHGAGGFDPRTTNISVSHSSIVCPQCGVSHDEAKRTSHLMTAKLIKNGPEYEFDHVDSDVMKVASLLFGSAAATLFGMHGQPACYNVVAPTVANSLRSLDVTGVILNSALLFLSKWNSSPAGYGCIIDMTEFSSYDGVSMPELSVASSVVDMMYDLQQHLKSLSRGASEYVLRNGDSFLNGIIQVLEVGVESAMESLVGALEAEEAKKAERMEADRSERAAHLSDLAVPDYDGKMAIDVINNEDINVELAGDPVVSRGLGKFGKMTIVEPERVVPFTGAIASRRWKPADAGDMPRNMQRWTTDKKVFGNKRKDKGGTLLIDVSGSMNVRAEDIERIIQRVPAATIAMYSGRGDRGELKVLVKSGRRVHYDELNSRSGGNIIDGPALMWLGKQARPRVWVSDGIATFSGDHTHSMGSQLAAAQVADKIRKRYAIHRMHLNVVQDEQKLKTALKKMR